VEKHHIRMGGWDHPIIGDFSRKEAQGRNRRFDSPRFEIPATAIAVRKTLVLLIRLRVVAAMERGEDILAGSTSAKIKNSRLRP